MMKNPLLVVATILIVITTAFSPIVIDHREVPYTHGIPEDFTPILRFVVASDVHVEDSGSDVEERRLKELFEYAYAYSDDHEGYDGLDGVFIVGDFSNRGTPYSMQKFFDIANGNLREGTTLRVSLGNHEYYADASSTIPNFLSISGYDSPNSHLVIDGYHFILLSPYKDGRGDGYDGQCREWLRNALDEATTDSEEGPIFVFTHHNVSGTVYGSEDWGVDDIKDILEGYERVVHFSGHSHFPINDPRSIWQGDFTALNTGTLSYSEMGLAGIRDGFVWPTDDEGGYSTQGMTQRDAAQFYIVEVDANDSILIQGFDILSGGFMMDPIYIHSVDDRKDFTYTDARKGSADTPEFSDDADIEILSFDEGEMRIRFTQAQCDDTVQHYRVELYKDGRFVDMQYRLSCSFYLPTPDTLTAKFSGLSDGGRYTVRITAVSPWEKMSEQLSYTFVT